MENPAAVSSESIDAVNALVIVTIKNLLQKGVNVKEIEKQTQANEGRIAELSNRVID